jgi:hypothetical protein
VRLKEVPAVLMVGIAVSTSWVATEEMMLSAAVFATGTLIMLAPRVTSPTFEPVNVEV